VGWWIVLNLPAELPLQLAAAGPAMSAMELSMSQRKAVTKATGTRYARVDRAAKKQILDELCDGLTGSDR